VDKEALPYLDGTRLDFVKDGLKETFKFDNPNAKNQCGCGESFNV
jgi:iron-sulfur cluster assembly protein